MYPAPRGDNPLLLFFYKNYRFPSTSNYTTVAFYPFIFPSFTDHESHTATMGNVRPNPKRTKRMSQNFLRSIPEPPADVRID
jgi:hypothetical protein